MADHHLLVEDVGKREVAEELGEGFVDSRIFVLGLDFSLEAIDHIHLLSLVVSSGHMQEILIGGLPGDQGEHALDGERASIDEVAVEQILVVDGGVAIDLEDVAEIVVLAVNIAANGDFFGVLNWVVDQRCVGVQDIFAFLNQLQSVSLVKWLLVFEVLHHFDHPF